MIKGTKVVCDWCEGDFNTVITSAQGISACTSANGFGPKTLDWKVTRPVGDRGGMETKSFCQYKCAQSWLLRQNG